MIRGVLVGVALLVCAAPTSAQVQADTAVVLTPPPGLDAYLPTPSENPLTAAGIGLGRRLFFDPLLSADGSVACASCHQPQRAFADSVALSRGVGGATGRRNTPALINSAYGRSFFWDGRSDSLEEQVLRPIEDPVEMNSQIPHVLERLRSDSAYRAQFQAVYDEGLTRRTLARALASFVRTILSGGSPFDLFRAGDATALSPDALAGFRLFTGRANCATCHVGPNFTDQRFHNTGIGWRDGEWTDTGRFAITGDSLELGAFKTPTLRDLDLTSPYMHDGSLDSLEEVVDFYNEGGRPNPFLDREIEPLRLTPEEKHALIAYLRSLTGRVLEGWPS